MVKFECHMCITWKKFMQPARRPSVGVILITKQVVGPEKKKTKQIKTDSHGPRN